MEIEYSSGGVPDSQDMDGVSSIIHLVEDLIWSQDDLPYRFFGLLRDSSIREGQLGGAFDVGEDAICEAGGGNGVVQGNELDDPTEIFNGLQGSDYPPSHCLRLSLTSSWATTLPALISARPLSIPLKKRTRSSISSQVAESGSS